MTDPPATRIAFPSGTLSFGLNLVKIGSGQPTLEGAIGHTGTTTSDGGTLFVGSAT